MQLRHEHTVTTLRGEIINPKIEEDNYVSFLLKDEYFSNLKFKTDYLYPNNYEDKIFIFHSFEPENEFIHVKEMSLDDFSGDVAIGIGSSKHVNFWKGRMGCSPSPEFIQRSLSAPTPTIKKYEYGHRVFMKFKGIQPNLGNPNHKTYDAYFDCGHITFNQRQQQYASGQLKPGQTWAQEDLPNLLVIDRGANLQPDTFSPLGISSIIYHMHMHP